jgi:hypothetical protein
MATVIDALLVTLGLDSSGFKKGADDAAKAQSKLTDAANQTGKAIDKQEKALSEAQVKRAKELDVRSKAMAQGFGKIRNEALALFAAFTGGSSLIGFVKDTVLAEAALGRMAENLGMSAQQLSAYQLANKAAGGSAEGMAAQIKAANATVSAQKISGVWGDSLNASAIWAAKSGGPSFDIGKVKNGTDLMKTQADIIQRVIEKLGASAGMLAAKEMGVSEDTYNLMKQGAGAMQAKIDAQKELSNQMAAGAAQAEELRKKMDALGNSFNASAVKITNSLMPAMEGALGLMKKLADFGDDHPGASNTIGKGLARVLAMFGDKDAQDALNANGDSSLVQQPGLNKGEDAELKKRWANQPGYDAQGNRIGGTPPKSRYASGKVTDESGGARKEPRGMRNNNPGNIEYGKFAIAHGATGSDGRFAIFPTMEAGQAAQQALLRGYMSSGADTVSKAINKWAPSSENNTSAYVDAVAKKMGVGPHQKLNESNIKGLSDAINGHENGAAWGRRNAAAAANMPTGAATAPSVTNNNAKSNTSTTEVKVGQITVNTKATDAPGIANAIGGAMNQYAFLAQANTGLA